jgi:hypothetical protein
MDEEIEGLVDDIPKQEEDPKQVVSGLQEQLINMEKKLAEATQAKKERDEIVDRFSKAIGFIEGSGVGKYDPNTGQIIKAVKEENVPDPLEQLKQEINSTEKSLLKQYKDGDLTQVEYYEQLQETVAPLKDKYKDMQFDKKISKVKEDLAPKHETVDNTIVKVTEEYNKLIDAYPDISDKNSQLYQKMNDIYLKNNKIYGNASYNGGKGDPEQYKDLIDRAVLELKLEGVDIKKQQQAIRNQFATPSSKGYKEPAKAEKDFSKEEYGMMISQGITSKSLLSDINKSMNKWENSGFIEMD